MIDLVTINQKINASDTISELEAKVSAAEAKLAAVFSARAQFAQARLYA